MSKKITFLSLIAIVTGLVVFFFAKDSYMENQLNQCISSTLAKKGIETIQITTKDRGKKPILKGNLNLSQKDILFEFLNQQCNIEEIQDFINISTPIKPIYSTLNFQIDHVNNVINISGIANNQNQIDNILSSFETAIQNNMPSNLTNSETPWTLSPDITINNQANVIDFSIAITLLFSAIDNIKLTDISIKNNLLTLNGLVRDQVSKNETINKIEQLFSDEYTIVNQLETVLKLKPDMPAFQIEILAPPVVEKPNQN